VRDKLLQYSNFLFENKKVTNLLTEDDIRSTGMGQSGEDIQLSSTARKQIPYNFECKNVEKLNIWSAISQAEDESKKHKTTPIVVFKRNRTKTYVTMEFDAFIELLKQSQPYQI